ncbi:hypothetical protein CEXT_490631, partial [Caerostris extrusa]
MGSIVDAVFRNLDYARMQLQSEIRIHFTGSTTAAVFRNVEIAITDRDSNHLMGSTAVSVLKHDEFCTYAILTK